MDTSHVVHFDAENPNMQKPALSEAIYWRRCVVCIVRNVTLHLVGWWGCSFVLHPHVATFYGCGCKSQPSMKPNKQSIEEIAKSMCWISNHPPEQAFAARGQTTPVDFPFALCAYFEAYVGRPLPEVHPMETQIAGVQTATKLKKRGVVTAKARALLATRGLHHIATGNSAYQ